MKTIIEEKREIMGKGEYIKWYCNDAEKILKKGKQKPLESCILNYSELYIYLCLIIVVAMNTGSLEWIYKCF